MLFYLVIRGMFCVPTDFLLPSIKIHKDDYVCIRSQSTANTVVSHGQVDVAERQTKDQEVLVIKLQLISGSEPPSEGLSTIEIIPQCLSYRRMISSVRNVTNATEDIRSLLLRRDCYTTLQPRCRSSQLTLSFSLDSSQKEAVYKAVNSHFTLIDGPPGKLHFKFKVS